MNEYELQDLAYAMAIELFDSDIDFIPLLSNSRDSWRGLLCPLRGNGVDDAWSQGVDDAITNIASRLATR
jgi:hypothetical protein